MIDPNEVQQMAKYMAALNGAPGSDEPGKHSVSNSNISEMKTILERLHSAADQIISEAPCDQALRDSLNMNLTENGVKYGSWEIIAKKNGKRFLYDVIHSDTQEKIASDLMLYEAAVGLARHLSEHGYVNSKKLLEMLSYEQDYAAAVNDMVIFKHHLVKSPHSPRKPIYEDRYGAAKSKALVAREQVYKLANRL